MLTKKQAHLLAAYEFKLITKTGTIVEIISADEYDIKIGNSGAKFYIGFDDIGVDYFILCRPYSQLTEEIEHENIWFKPMDKILDFNKQFYLDVGEFWLSYEIEGKESETMHISVDDLYKIQDLIFTWNFKPKWLDTSLVKYIS